MHCTVWGKASLGEKYITTKYSILECLTVAVVSG